MPPPSIMVASSGLWAEKPRTASFKRVRGGALIGEAEHRGSGDAGQHGCLHPHPQGGEHQNQSRRDEGRGPRRNSRAKRGRCPPPDRRRGRQAEEQIQPGGEGEGDQAGPQHLPDVPKQVGPGEGRPPAGRWWRRGSTGLQSRPRTGWHHRSSTGRPPRAAAMVMQTAPMVAAEPKAVPVRKETRQLSRKEHTRNRRGSITRTE